MSDMEKLYEQIEGVNSVVRSTSEEMDALQDHIEEHSFDNAVRKHEELQDAIHEFWCRGGKEKSEDKRLFRTHVMDVIYLVSNAANMAMLVVLIMILMKLKP